MNVGNICIHSYLEMCPYTEETDSKICHLEVKAHSGETFCKIQAYFSICKNSVRVFSTSELLKTEKNKSFCYPALLNNSSNHFILRYLIFKILWALKIIPCLKTVDGKKINWKGVFLLLLVLVEL